MSDKHPWRQMYRVEPDPRNVSPVPGAQAPTGDALWLLGRQWWMGEMAFFDGGTPMSAQVDVGTERLNAARRPQTASDNMVPSETLAAPMQLHWRDRLRLGQSLLAHSGARGSVADLVRALAPLAPLEERHPILNRMGPDRKIDGAAVLKLSRAGRLDLPRNLLSIVSEWAAEQPIEGDSFNPDTRRHSVTLEGEEGSRLATDGAAGPKLHWSDMTGKAVNVTAARQEKPLSRVSVPGAQPHRWWRFEEHELDWTAAPAGPSDLGQLLIAASFAEQGQLLWRCGVETATNALVTVQAVGITDTFGTRQDASDASTDTLRGWCLPSGAMPVLADAPLLQGAALEQASLRTDPTDNLAWLTETIVRGPDGRGTIWQSAPPFEEPSEPVVALRQTPPENWRAYGIESNKLVQLPFDGQAATGATIFAQATFALRPAQIGARGFRYTMQPMLGRAPSGRRVAWTVAYALPCERAGSSSGLRHDVIQRPVL